MTSSDPTKHLLVVDDDYLVGRGIARWFRRRRYAVRLLARATDVLDLSETYDCAILDIDIADGDGVALGRELRETGRAKHVVFFSAHSGDAVLAAARQVGPLVPKSSGIVELERVVDGLPNESQVRALRGARASTGSG